MTIIEHSLFKKIAPTELIAQATHKLETPPENLRALISHFNDMSRFVAFTICSLHGQVCLFMKGFLATDARPSVN